ncbi:TPA: zinc ribbon domain-containing protein [Escherichia coli]
MSQHEQFCQACGMPISAPDAHSASDQYCAYCSDSNGNLKPWEEAVSGLASFLDSWQKVGPEEAHKRAKRYLTAMPAWAHKAESDLS